MLKKRMGFHRKSRLVIALRYKKFKYEIPKKRFKANKKLNTKKFIQKYDLIRQFEQVIEKHQQMLEECFIRKYAEEYIVWLIFMKEWIISPKMK